MHETHFFDASFVVFIGFIVFMGIVLKFGYRKTIQGIDSQIKDVSLVLEEAQTLLKIAQERKDDEKQLEKQLATEISQMKELAEKQIEELKRQTDSDIKDILDRKQNSADATLDLMRNSTIQHLQEFLTQHAVVAVQDTIKQSSKTQAQKINDAALVELKDLLKAGVNTNGGAKSKAIA